MVTKDRTDYWPGDSGLLSYPLLLPLLTCQVLTDANIVPGAVPETRDLITSIM